MIMMGACVIIAIDGSTVDSPVISAGFAVL